MKKKKIIILVLVGLVIGAIVCVYVKESRQDPEAELKRVMNDQLKGLEKPKKVQIRGEVNDKFPASDSKVQFSNQELSINEDGLEVKVTNSVLDESERNSMKINTSIRKYIKQNLKIGKHKEIWTGSVEYANDAMISMMFSSDKKKGVAFYCNIWRDTGDIISLGEIVDFSAEQTQGTLKEKGITIHENNTNFYILHVNPEKIEGIKDYNILECFIGGNDLLTNKSAVVMLKDFS